MWRNTLKTEYIENCFLINSLLVEVSLTFYTFDVQIQYMSGMTSSRFVTSS